MPRRHCLYLILVFLLGAVFSRLSLSDRVLYEALNKVQKSSLEEVSRRELIEGALNGILARSPYYPYTSYIPPEEENDFEDEIQGVFSGIGIRHMAFDEASGELWFTPIYGSPAWEAGLRFGDRITAIDGEKVEGKSLLEIMSCLRGEENSQVRLTVRSCADILRAYCGTESEKEELAKAEREGETRDENDVPAGEDAPDAADANREVLITRGTVHLDVVCGYRRSGDGDWCYTIDDHPEIGYIRLDQFTEEAPVQWDEALKALQEKNISAFILDLRGNPGGMLEGAVFLSSRFLPKGSEVATVRGRGEVVKRRLVTGGGEKYDWQMAVLIDHESASAAEMVSGALADHGRATLVGTRSYGKGTVQEILPLPRDMGTIRITCASFYRPSGKPIHRLHDASDEDEWGIVPEKENLIELDEYQMTASALLTDYRSLPPADDDPAREALIRLIFDRAQKRDLFDDEDADTIAETECDFVNPSSADPQFERAVEILLAGEKESEEKTR